MLVRKQVARTSVSASVVLLAIGWFTPTVVIGGALNRQTSSITIPINDKCLIWTFKVDSTLILPKDAPGVDERNEQSVMEGIECLLTLEGNKNKAKFSGATNPYVSQLFKPATVEVGALYYISYLYTQKWDHADAIALVYKKEEPNSTQTVRRAYDAYRNWFKRVKKLGLADARKIGLAPLKGKPVRWY